MSDERTFTNCCQCEECGDFPNQEAAEGAGWVLLEDGAWICYECAMADAW